jgi:DNA modification methylase
VVSLFPQSSGGGSHVKKRGASIHAYGEATDSTFQGVSDSGSAARFFYCAKTSKRDRDDGNHHPTVKPTDLMRYLCRLVTPSGGTVLDPFMGSGSTGKAAVLEGFQFIGIEREADYIEIARTRIKAVQGIFYATNGS